MIEIRTRKDFLDIADAIDICKFKDADISFRESCYTLKSKVNKNIRERLNDVFKIDEEKQKEFELAKFEYAKKFAVRNDNGEIIYNNDSKTSYGIDYSKFNKNEIDNDIDCWIKSSGWKEHVEEVERIEKEKVEWLNKKIKLDLKKVDSISKIPTIVGSYDSNTTINENVIYSFLVELLCSEKVEDSEEDGTEIE